MQEAEIEGILRAALEALYQEEIAILQRDVAERTICARLAAILQRSFEHHAVHAEYNRHGVDPKAIEVPDADGVLTRSRVSPDIIVHQPGHDDENLLVIEAKKTTNPVTDDADVAKLAQIKGQIGYRFAVFLRLPVGPHAEVAAVQSRWI